MTGLIILSLGLMLVITTFNIVLGAEWQEFTFSEEYAVSVGIDEYMGALAIIIALIAATSLVGISCLGSGLSDPSVRFIVLGVAYGSLWGVISVLSLNLIIDIEIFGAIIYAFLSMIYTIGVIQKMSEG